MGCSCHIVAIQLIARSILCHELIAGLAGLVSHALSSEVLSDQDKRAKYDKFGWAAKGEKPETYGIYGGPALDTSPF